MLPTASITFYSVVVAIHILAVVIAFGVTFVYPLIIPLTIRTAPDKVGWLHRMQAEIGKKIIAPTGGIVLVAGIYLAAKSPLWDFKDWWVGFGIAAILVLEGLGGAFFGPREEKLAELAERDIAAAAGGEVSFSAEYRALGRQVGMVGALSSLLVAVAVVIMVLGARGSFL